MDMELERVGKSAVVVYRFSKLGYSARSMISIPNHMFSERNRRDRPNDALFGAGALFRAE